MIAIDAHTHVYGVDNAASTLLDGGLRLQSADVNVRCAVLFFCETEGQRDFDQVRSRTDLSLKSADHSQWTVSATNEPVSLCLTSPDRMPIVVIRGQQIITSENLEVLAVGHESRLVSGRSLAATLQESRTAGCQVILPWGVGKWLGKRGRLIDGVLSDADLAGVHLGDNGGRPWFWPVPRFDRARARGVKVLRGSDPLPIQGDEARIGSYASLYDGRLDLDAPWQDIVTLLKTSDCNPEGMGSPMGLGRFLASQIALRTSRLA